MNILDRYLAGVILANTALVLAVLIALFSFVQFVDALGDVGNQFSLVHANPLKARYPLNPPILAASGGR